MTNIPLICKGIKDGIIRMQNVENIQICPEVVLKILRCMSEFIFVYGIFSPISQINLNKDKSFLFLFTTLLIAMMSTQYVIDFDL